MLYLYMNSTDRKKLFLTGCFTVRLLIALFAKYVSVNMRWALPLLGGFALIPAIMFIGQFSFGLRETGKGGAGGPIWWANWRLVHGFMFLLFAIFAFRKESFAWIFLFIDVFIGLGAWFKHYY